MRVFVAVCDAKGFASAARKLRIAPSAVTRLVAGLEEDLGVRLLQRTTRSIKLTDAGSRFLERTRRILSDIEEAELSAQQERGTPRGLLRVSAPILFGRLNVAPTVERYLDHFPDVQVELSLSDRIVNLVEEGVDIAVRIGTLADSALIAQRIGATRRVLVASPQYLSNRGVPHTPQELASHSIIAFHAGAQQGEWQLYGPLDRRTSIALSPRFSTNSGDAAIAYCIRGGGIAAVFHYQVASALSRGLLIEVLNAFGSPPLPIHAVFPSTRLLSTKVRTFLRMLQEDSREWRAQEDSNH